MSPMSAFFSFGVWAFFFFFFYKENLFFWLVRHKIGSFDVDMYK